MKWKPDWEQARTNLTRWWNRQGLAVAVFAPRDEPLEPIPQPQEPEDLEARWTDPAYRTDKAEHEMAWTFFGGEAFPYFDPQIGPGSLGLFLGSEPGFATGTVWYKPCIDDPDHHPPLRLDAENRWFKVHMALIEEGLRRADGRYLVGIPDLVENIDTLAQLRDPQTLLMDMIERPAWVERCTEEINQAYFECFDAMFAKVRDTDGGNAFCAFKIWGPGKTAKIQCDFCCMISPAMFDRFVAPSLSAQCDWLDYSVYHLDGPEAFPHVDSLLGIDSLNAIQWTSGARNPGGGDPCWQDLYRRIRKGGKGIEAFAAPDEVIPLIETIGPEGLLVVTSAPDQASAEKLLADVQQYR